MAPRVAVDAMGGDHGPGVVVDGTILACRELGLSAELVGPEAMVRAQLLRAGAGGLPIEVIDAPDVVGMGEKVSLLHAQEALLDPGRARAGAGRLRERLLLGRQHRRLLDHRQAGAGHARRGGSAGPGGGRPQHTRPDRADRRGRERAVQGAQPRGVRGHGERLHARRLPHQEPAGRAHEHGRGRDQGQRPHEGGPRGPEGLHLELRRQRRGARRLHRQGGRRVWTASRATWS